MITFYVAWAAYHHCADSTITRTDRWFLFAAMTASPIWHVSHDLLWAVVMLTGIDLLGFGPTFRKSWQLSERENAIFFALFALRNLFVTLSLENYVLTTALFPTATGIACGLLVMVIAARRWQRKSWTPTVE